MFQFQQRLQFLKVQIKQWNSATFGNIFQAHQALTQEMEKLQQTIINEGRTEAHNEQEKNL